LQAEIEFIILTEDQIFGFFLHKLGDVQCGVVITHFYIFVFI